MQGTGREAAKGARGAGTSQDRQQVGQGGEGLYRSGVDSPQKGTRSQSMSFRIVFVLYTKQFSAETLLKAGTESRFASFYTRAINNGLTK